MDLGSVLGLSAVFLLVIANGFFVATEFAIVAVRRSRLEQLVAEGRASAKDAQDVVGHLDAYIAATQLGITMASLALGWIGEPALAHLIEPPLEHLVGEVAFLAADGVAVAISFAFITALHIVIGELAPKGLALQHPEGTSLWVARPIKVFYAIFRWPVSLLNGVGNAALRLVGLEPASGHEMVHSVEELRVLVRSSQQAGVVEESEARIAQRAFVFADRTAGALMTPRTELEAIPVDMPRAQLLERIRRAQHSRLVVYRGTLDDFVGVLHMRDLLPLIDQPDVPIDLEKLVRPALVVPATKPADDLLEEMRQARRYLAVVLDEFGGTAGIVTLGDLVAALVGRLEEEQVPGRSVDGRSAQIVARPEDPSVIEGLTRLDELEEMLGTKLGPEAHEDAETVGGLIMSLLGRIPVTGDEVEVAGRKLRVERLDGRRVDRVRVSQPETEAAARR